MSTEATTNEAADEGNTGDAYEGDSYDDGTGEESEGESDRPRAGIYKGRAVAGAGSDEHWGGEEDAPQVALDFFIPALERTVTAYLSFSEKAKPYSIERLKACGWDGSATLPLVGIDKNEVDIEIKYTIYNGKTQMKVDIRTFGRFKHAIEPAKARSFMADLVKNAASLDKAGPAPTGARTGAPAKGATTYPADWDKAGPSKPADPARAGKVNL